MEGFQITTADIGNIAKCYNNWKCKMEKLQNAKTENIRITGIIYSRNLVV